MDILVTFWLSPPWRQVREAVFRRESRAYVFRSFTYTYSRVSFGVKYI